MVIVLEAAVKEKLLSGCNSSAGRLSMYASRHRLGLLFVNIKSNDLARDEAVRCECISMFSFDGLFLDLLASGVS